MLPVELRQMRYFVAVAEELHLGRAAARLQISTPTLSQQIKAVERQIGAPLLVRNGRGLNLTRAGEALLGEARKVLRAAEHALRETRRVAGGDQPSLRFGMLIGAPAWLPARIARLQPDCRMETLNGTTAEQLQRLDSGEVELALVRTPVRLPPGVRLAEVAVEELGVLMSARHPLATCADVDIADLAGQELIWFARNKAPGFHDATLGRLRSFGGAVVVSENTTGAAPWWSPLLTHRGAISLSSARAAEVPQLAWRPLRGRPLSVTFAAAWHTDCPNPTLSAIVRELSRRRLDQIPDRKPAQSDRT